MLISQIVLGPLLLGKARNKLALHVGAHRAEERSLYQRLGFGRVDWIEGQPELAHELKQTLPSGTNRIFQACVWGTSGLPMELSVTSNSQSSSLLELGSHLSSYPNVTVSQKISVTTVRLDELLHGESYAFVNLDIQGAELEALRGMGDLITSIDIIYCEVNREEVYKDCALVVDLDKWLNEQGFARIITKWTSKGWGDAIYARNTRGWRIWLATILFRVTELLH